MQSAILLALMVLVTLFMTIENSRNNNTETNSYAAFKSNNVAANILQYHDVMVSYMLNNYAGLHNDFAASLGNVETIKQVEYQPDYNQKNLKLFLNYQSVAFNYSNINVGGDQVIPVLYLATSFDSYSNSELAKTYAGILLTEIMGNLGENLAKHVYQGVSTYWTVPWVFSQANCTIDEFYSQIPDGVNGSSNLTQVQNLFNLFCRQIQDKSSYKFLRYVYIQPVIDPANI